MNKIFLSLEIPSSLSSHVKICNTPITGWIGVHDSILRKKRGHFILGSAKHNSDLPKRIFQKLGYNKQCKNYKYKFEFSWFRRSTLHFSLLKIDNSNEITCYLLHYDQRIILENFIFEEIKSKWQLKSLFDWNSETSGENVK